MTTYTHTEDELAGRAPRLSDDDLENFDVDAAMANVKVSDPIADGSDLRAIAEAADALGAASDRLAAAVRAARSNGRAWSRIGGQLGITKQAAQQRFRQIS